jgi:hypothetical protein
MHSIKDEADLVCIAHVSFFNSFIRRKYQEHKLDQPSCPPGMIKQA